jgi:hypothetical protein
MVSTSIRRTAAKRLRANSTPHERVLWRALKELPVDGTHFRRQAPIGPYVVDFLCPAHISSLNSTADITTRMKLPNVIVKGSFGLSGRVIASSASGIPRSPVT